MSIKEMTGLEVMTAMKEGELDHPPMAGTIPMKIVKVEEGSIHFEVKADKNHMNTMGGIHGGFSATVMDTITGCAVHTTLGKGVTYGTIDLNVKMTRPIPIDTVLYAEGHVINKSRRLAISQGTIKDEKGKIYAHGSASCMILDNN